MLISQYTIRDLPAPSPYPDEPASEPEMAPEVDGPAWDSRMAPRMDGPGSRVDEPASGGAQGSGGAQETARYGGGGSY